MRAPPGERRPRWGPRRGASWPRESARACLGIGPGVALGWAAESSVTVGTSLSPDSPVSVSEGLTEMISAALAHYTILLF